MAELNHQPQAGESSRQHEPDLQPAQPSNAPIDPLGTDGENVAEEIPDLLEISVKFARVDYEHTKKEEDILVSRGDNMQTILSKSTRLADVVRRGESIAAATGRMGGLQYTADTEWEICKHHFPPAEASIYERWALGAALPPMPWSATTVDGNALKKTGHQTAQPSERVRALRAIYRGQAPAVIVEADVDYFLQRFTPLRPLLSALVRLQRLRDASDLSELVAQQREDAELRATKLATSQIEEELHRLMMQARHYKASVEENIRILHHRMHMVGGAGQEAMLGIGGVKMEEDLLEDALQARNEDYEQAMMPPSPPKTAEPQPVRELEHEREPERERSISVSSAPPRPKAEDERSQTEPPVAPSAQAPAAPPHGHQRQRDTAVPDASQKRNSHDAVAAMLPLSGDMQPAAAEAPEFKQASITEAEARRGVQRFMGFSGGGENGEAEDEDEEEEDEEEMAASETVAMVGSSPNGEGAAQRRETAQQLDRSQSPSPFTPSQTFPIPMEVPDQLKAISRASFSFTEERTETTQIQTQTQGQTKSSTINQTPTPSQRAARSSREVYTVSDEDEDEEGDETEGRSRVASGSKRQLEPVVEIETSQRSQPRSPRRAGPSESAAASSSRKKSKKERASTPKSKSGSNSSSLSSAADNDEDQMDEDKENEDNDDGKEDEEEEEPQRKAGVGSGRAKPHVTRSQAKSGRSQKISQQQQSFNDLTNSDSGGGSSNRKAFRPHSTK